MTLKELAANLEKRLFPRVTAYNDFLVEFPTEGIRSTATGNGYDISENGVCFTSYSKLTPNQEIEIYITFSLSCPVQQRIRVPAKVVRCYAKRGSRKYEIACQLNHITSATQAAVRDFIIWHSPDAIDSSAFSNLA